MKKKFSKKWLSSKQPRKQRKYRYNAPLHLRKKFISTHLSKQLQGLYKTRAFPLRKGDTVKVMRGNFKNKTAKVTSIETKKIKVYLEGLQKTRKDGTKVNVQFNPSNLLITELNLEDKERLKSLDRRKLKNKISKQ